MQKKWISAALLLLSTPSWAMFCPNNFNVIDLGNTIAQVEAQCGKPSKTLTTKSTANDPQEWTFFVALPPLEPMAPNTSQGTMKMTFAFIDGKVTNMTSNGIGVGATTACANVNLQIGNTIEQVEKACGKPAMVAKTTIQGAAAPAPKETETTTWTYTPANALPVKLIFIDGKLKERS